MFKETVVGTGLVLTEWLGYAPWP